MKQPDHEAVTRPNSKEFMKALRGNRDFLSNPVTIALSAVTLFLISQLIGGLLALPIIKSVSDTNIQLLTVVLFSAITLCVIILLLKKLLRFKLSSIGIARPKLKFMFQAVPAFALYFIVSAGFTALAIRFFLALMRNKYRMSLLLKIRHFGHWLPHSLVLQSSRQFLKKQSFEAYCIKDFELG